MKGIVHQRIVTVLLICTGNDQNNDDGRKDKSHRCNETAKKTRCLETCICRHVDSYWTGCGLGNGNHISKLSCSEPFRMTLTHPKKERKRHQASAYGEESGLEEFPEKLQINHCCSSRAF